MEFIDKKLLNLIQTGFPVAPEPYRLLGEVLGISEGEVISRIQKLLDKGIIRRLGAFFDSRKLGYSGALCALKVDHEKIDQVAEIVNSYHGITHNYLREHPFNMWFTILAETREEIDKMIDEIKNRTGIDEIMTLPAQSVFKIRVNFDLD